MAVQRRQFLTLITGTLAAPAISRVAWAQTYPTRPVRIIAPYPAGGAVDIHARLVGQWLSERLGQPFIVENRPGANGNIGTEIAANSPPDGYTLLLMGGYNVLNTALYNNLHFDFAKDIVPVASIDLNPFVMEVNLSVPVRSVPEFISYAKAHPGKINMASGGIGSPQHVYGELFKTMTGVDLVHVPYKGSGAALPDLMAGQVQVMFDAMAASIEYIRAGRVRALAVTTATRQKELPDVPTVGEFVPGYEASGWLGIGAPRGTPKDIIDKLNEGINASLADPKNKAQISKLGSTVFVSSPTKLHKYVADEVEKWGKVIKLAHIQL